MNAPHDTTQEAELARIEAELARQDAEWREAQEQLRAFGDVELSLAPTTAAALDEVTSLAAHGTVPLGLVRI